MDVFFWVYEYIVITRLLHLNNVYELQKKTIGYDFFVVVKKVTIIFEFDLENF